MNNHRLAYVALGSNKGNKFNNLQDAINLIHEQVGTVKSISKIYSSPAFGFEGEDFFNACLSVETPLSPNKLLKHLLVIEKQLGRERKIKGYESRSIDLDIIFYADEIIESKSLTIPHPEAHKRNFVLQPLCDITAKFIHPKLKKSVEELLETSLGEAKGIPQNIWLKNPIKSYDFSKNTW